MYNYSDDTRTIDGYPVEVGMRVVNSDWDWGTIEKMDKFQAGWFDMRLDNGTRAYSSGTRCLRFPTAGVPADPNPNGYVNEKLG